MCDIVREIYDIKLGLDEGIVRCGVFVDGIWQRRGFFFLNGCVSVISMDIGKVVDVEFLSKVCIKCREYENDFDILEIIVWRVDYRVFCKVNFKGLVLVMELEGVF